MKNITPIEYENMGYGQQRIIREFLQFEIEERNTEIEELRK